MVEPCERDAEGFARETLTMRPRCQGPPRFGNTVYRGFNRPVEIRKPDIADEASSLLFLYCPVPVSEQRSQTGIGDKPHPGFGAA